MLSWDTKAACPKKITTPRRATSNKRMSQTFSRRRVCVCHDNVSVTSGDSNTKLNEQIILLFQQFYISATLILLSRCQKYKPAWLFQPPSTCPGRCGARPQCTWECEWHRALDASESRHCRCAAGFPPADPASGVPNVTLWRQCSSFEVRFCGSTNITGVGDENCKPDARLEQPQ